MNGRKWNKLPVEERWEILERIGSSCAPDPRRQAHLKWGALPLAARQRLRRWPK